MFSRVGRLTTFGAQAVSNCPLRRDNIYQQPLKITAPINDQLVNFAHNFSDSVRQRTTSYSNDPFLGVATDDDEVIKELELLDLDSWHTKPRPPCAAPSDELELDQFWDGKNITVCGRDPRRYAESTDHFELEAWRPTDTWQSGGMGHQQQSHQQHHPQSQTVGHSSTTEMMHDFSNFGDNMMCSSPLFRSPSKSSIDQLTGGSISRIDELNMPPHQERKLSKFELDVETESKAVDWEAWNHYLESDDDAFKRPEAFFKEFKEDPMFVMSSDLTTSTSSPDSGIGLFDSLPSAHPPQQHFLNLSTSSSSANLFRLATPAAPQLPVQLTNPARISLNPAHHDEDLFSSGPLLCVPKQEELFDDYIQKEDSDEDYIPTSESRRTSSRLQRKSTTPLFLRRRDSERSWTPASDDFYLSEEKQKFKKRGVVLKPSVDEETDRRRALNRIAAVRYREKKRAEKMGRKKEFQDVIDRNRILVQKERQLKREISSMKKELRKMGAIIH